jgi:predicted MFS family arabinose efflux permease
VSCPRRCAGTRNLAPVRGLIEVVAPKRLGPGFRWLLASSWVSNLGDGFALAAGPLLVASQTRDPRLVAMATVLVQLPWLLFGLVAGVLADRLNRRTMVITVDLLRSVVLALLALALVTGVIDIALVLVAVFLMGTAEVFANTAAATLLPSLVDRADLALANARLQTGFVTVNQLAGPPIGAALFAGGKSMPFFGQAVLVAAGAVLVSRMALRRPSPRTDQDSRALRAEIGEGLRWVMRNAAVRTLVLTILIFNVTFGAAWSVLVLYARQRLGMGAVGFGLLTTASAIGGIAATIAYGRITRHVSLGDLMRIGLIIETFTHLCLALNTSAVVALVIFGLFGAHAFIWGTTSVTVRQRAVPEGLQGRVNGVNNVASFGGIVVGAAVGGPIASTWGITAPFWFAFVGSALFVVLIWRQLAHVAHNDAAQSAVA